jgi:CrcB protein
MPQPIDPRTLGAVVAGGAVGVLARAAIVAPTQGDATVWATVTINIVGSFLLGVVVGAFGTDFPRWKAFLGTGVLGGFTTYSAFAVHSVEALSTPVVMLAVVAVSVVGGVVAAAAGILLGRRVRPAGAAEPEIAE